MSMQDEELGIKWRIEPQPNITHSPFTTAALSSLTLSSLHADAVFLFSTPLPSTSLPGKNLEMAAAAASPPWDFSCDLEVDFESDENASIVYAALAIDKELQPDKVKRQMSVANGKLSVHFEGVEARFLRASFSAFVDVLTLATKTIEQFGPGMDL
ncbi:hypothetical protein QYF36_011908 [Acer negundo]|nr:hypothetical protein QYF36_011908 [Acer negundo]